VFANVRDERELPDVQFMPSAPGRIRFILDYPFDGSGDYTPRHDAERIHRMRRDDITAATIVWLPHFFSAQKSAQLGRLLKIKYLLERDRLDDYVRNRSATNGSRSATSSKRNATPWKTSSPPRYASSTASPAATTPPSARPSAKTDT